MNSYHQHSSHDEESHGKNNKSNINIKSHNFHDPVEDNSENIKNLKTVLGLIFTFSIVELIGSIETHSLALLSDFSHMLTDSFSLIVAIFMSSLSLKPANNNYSYGHGRADTIGALINSLFMLGIIFFIFLEGIHRIFSPETTNGAGVFLIALIGFIINLVSFKILHGKHNHDHDQSLNNKAAVLHVLGDLLGSFVAMVAGIAIYLTGASILDPLLSILVSIIMFFPTLKILKSSFRIVMEGVPHEITFEDVGKTIENVEKVKSVHDLHVWTMDSQDVALTAHVVIPDLKSWDDVLKNIQLELLNKHNISHVTIQPEKEKI